MSKTNFIFIIGFMASGKSTFGKRVAKELGYNFIDTDAYIQKQTNSSIEHIFEEQGEKEFRKMENKALKEILTLEGNYVVSTGGGTPCHQYRLNRMLENGKVIYLEIDVKSVMNRLQQAKQKRPLLDNLSQEALEHKIQSLLSKRTKYYEQAHVTISSLEAKKVNLDFFVNS